MEQSLSESGLREQAELAGYPVTHEQFASYRQWGLIPEPDPASGRWPHEVVARLIRVREFGQTVRALPRRVILLQREELFRPLPLSVLVKAMVVVGETMRQPARKLKRVDRASRAFARSQLAGSPGGRLPHGPRLPSTKEWPGLLQSTPSDILESRLPAHCHFAAMLSEFPQLHGVDLSNIPHEELIVLLAVRDFAAIRDAQEAARHQQQVREEA